MGNTFLTPGHDNIACLLSNDGRYTVSALRTLIDSRQNVTVTPNQVNWLRSVPSKILCFVWRAAMGRIPTAVALRKRGMTDIITSCSACIDGEEDSDHILANCNFSREVINLILQWCGLNNKVFLKVEDILAHAHAFGNSKNMNKRMTVICYGLLWGLWHHRNARLFKNAFTHPYFVAESIKVNVYFWLNHRGKGSVGDWEN
ncbi:hypothetical protein LXL04_023484 [Taraxacum kok-saghyz]